MLQMFSRVTCTEGTQYSWRGIVLNGSVCPPSLPLRDVIPAFRLAASFSPILYAMLCSISVSLWLSVIVARRSSARTDVSFLFLPELEPPYQDNKVMCVTAVPYDSVYQ